MVEALKQQSFFKLLWPFMVISFGCFLSALGYTLFVTPMGFYEGGVIGIAFLAKYIFGLPIGATQLIITIVIFIIGTKILGKGFGIKSIYGVFFFSLIFDGLEKLKGIYFPGVISDNMLLNAFYGGIMVGSGMALVFYHGSSTGGSDAFAQIMRWLKRIPVGKTLITVDIIVLLCSTLWAYKKDGVHGLEIIMYTFVFIWIQIKSCDLLINGLNASQRIMVTTDHPELIKKAIFSSLNRGVTTFKGTGGYTGIERTTITTVLPKKQVPELRRIVGETDPNAFVIVQDVQQVYGLGFEPLPVEGETVMVSGGEVISKSVSKKKKNADKKVENKTYEKNKF